MNPFKRVIKHLLRRAKSSLKERELPRIEQWRLVMADGKVELGDRTRITDAVLEVRGTGGSVIIGDDCELSCTVVLEKGGAAFEVGSRTHIGGNTLFSLASRATIGDDVLISFGVLIVDHDSHSLDFNERQADVTDWMRGEKNWSHVPIDPVNVGDKAWIGARAIILKGVTIGEGAIVGAGSVVTRNVAPWTVVAGNPARVIRQLSGH